MNGLWWKWLPALYFHWFKQRGGRMGNTSLMGVCPTRGRESDWLPHDRPPRKVAVVVLDWSLWERVREGIEDEPKE